jgi:hypothetical protein
MGTGTYSTGAARKPGIELIISSRNSSQKVHHVLWRFVKNVYNHPYENMEEGISRIVGCSFKYLMLNKEKLLE